MYTRQDVESVFNEAIALVRKGWCQGADARGFEGIPCEATDDDAEEWSIEGAFDRAAIEAGFYEIYYSNGYPCKLIARDLWQLIEASLIPLVGNIHEYENGYDRTKEQVIRVLTKAREKLSQPHAITCSSWKYTGCENVIEVCTIPNCTIDGDHQDEDRLCSDCERAEASADWDE